MVRSIPIPPINYIILKGMCHFIKRNKGIYKKILIEIYTMK